MTWLSTPDLDNLFFARVETVANNLGTVPIELLKVWMSESAVRANAHNPNGHASGIFQVMPPILRGLGYPGTHEDFRRLSAADQCKPWAERYYRPHKGLLTNATAIYVATFLPAFIAHAHDPEYVLVSKVGKPEDWKLGWAYQANAVFDTNRDLRITVGELTYAIERSCKGKRWEEIRNRMARQVGEIELEYDTQPRKAKPQDYDLATILGVQQALTYLGADPGPLDGVFGPLTQAAVKGFQQAAGITVDGIYGPVTRRKLQEALLRASA